MFFPVGQKFWLSTVKHIITCKKDAFGGRAHTMTDCEGVEEEGKRGFIPNVSCVCVIYMEIETN